MSKLKICIYYDNIQYIRFHIWTSTFGCQFCNIIRETYIMCTGQKYRFRLYNGKGLLKCTHNYITVMKED
jgi:hypothetical protein